jgi:integrase/recombinase XerD
MSYLQKIRSSLVLFYDFLKVSQTIHFEQIVFPEIKKGIYIPTVLSKEGVQTLFNTCDESLLGKRNKALLAIYYGCGLRRQEGTDLNIEDIDLNKGQIFIAKSKTRRQRNVPINKSMLDIVEDYLFNVREKLIDKEDSQNAFLVTEKGNRLAKETVVYILKSLLKEAKITTKASPHTLRHSIATHLLQSGMKLENISLFLGHRSLDSTQIYTHLVEITN